MNLKCLARSALSVALLALTSCRPSGKPAAVSGSELDSVPGYVREEESCGFVEARRWGTARDLVHEYVQRDGTGEFLSAARWLDSALSCVGHLPGWDQARVVKSVEIAAGDSTDLTQLFHIRYEVGGTIEAGTTLHRSQEVERITMRVVRTPWGWRIAGPQLPPHVLPLAVIQRFKLRGADSAYVDELAGEMPVVPNVPVATLLRDGMDWDPRFRESSWLGLYETTAGSWSLRPVTPRPRGVEDACRDSRIEVVSFDPAGARFAVAAAVGLREGSGSTISSRRLFVPPGDSILLPRPVMGNYELRARGKVIDVGTGHVVENYVLSFIETDDEHAHGWLVWRGEYADVAPSVDWIGDLNNDGDADMLATIPTVGYGEALRLLLSDHSGEESVLRTAAELEIPDC